MNWLLLAALIGSVHQPVGSGNLLRAPGVAQSGQSAASAAVVGTVTLDAPAYTRTVTASSYTLTGSYTGSLPEWAADPSGATGTCTDSGGGAFACVVTVTPDAVGEGVEVITVTSGAASDTETLGFYVAGAHSTFLSQNVNGSYNVGLTDLDAVSTWENVGTSALDVTQAGAASLKPTFRTGIVGGQPVVRCDGGDRVAAATASDWNFLHHGADFTVEYVSMTSAATGNPSTYIANTTTTHGFGSVYSSGFNYFQIYNASPTLNIDMAKATTTAVFRMTSLVLQDNGLGGAVDAYIYIDGGTATSSNRQSAYSVTTSDKMSICARADGVYPFTGDLFAMRIYQSALTSTQRAINKAVYEWALGGPLPVTP